MQQYSNKIELDPDVGAVVVGLDQHFSYLKLHKAALYLKDENCLFICTNMDETVIGQNKNLYPGTGSLVSAIQAATGREPSILGKPESFSFYMLQAKHDWTPSRCVIIGDR